MVGVAMKCILCGRSMTSAAVLVASMPVGPKCARRAGLMPLAAKRAGLVKPGPLFRRHATRLEVDQMDLFGGEA